MSSILRGLGLENINSKAAPGWYGRIYLGMPLNVFTLPARVQQLNQDRHVKQHRIPGRDGDVSDDMGSPARVVRVVGKVSPDILHAHITDMRRVSPSRVRFQTPSFFDPRAGITPNPDIMTQAFTNPSFFIKTLNGWWLSRTPIPLISDPISSLFIFKKLDWEQVGGDPGVYVFHIILLERLPFSLSSVFGMFTLSALNLSFAGARQGLGAIGL